MATVFNERPNSRESSTNPESITMQYVLAGLSTDDAVCKAFAISATPQRMLSYTGAMLWRQDLKMEPQGGNVWYVTVPYGPLAPPTPLEMKWAFSTTGGTKKITQAIAHVGSWGVLQNANYLPPPDHQGTIGVDEDGNVEGCEIVIPQFKWTETWQLPVSMVPWNYADLCEALTGTVCNAYFRGRGPGRVRFDGAEGMQSRQKLQHRRTHLQLRQRPGRDRPDDRQLPSRRRHTPPERRVAVSVDRIPDHRRHHGQAPREAARPSTSSRSTMRKTSPSSASAPGRSR